MFFVALLLTFQYQILREKANLILLKSGDVEAFDCLYNSYHKKLFAFIYKFLNNWHDTEDLVQKIFVTIWEKRVNINSDKSFNSYLFTIARNEIYDILKKKVITEYYGDCIMDVVSKDGCDIEEKKVIETIYSLLEKVPERRRRIFLMSKDMGLTYKQIGKQLGISENTVDTQIRNVLNYLREELPKYIKMLILILLGAIS